MSPEQNNPQPTPEPQPAPQTPSAFVSNPEPNSDPVPMPNPFASQPPKKNKKTTVILVCILLILALGAGAYFLFFNKSESQVANQSQNTTNANSKNDSESGESQSENQSQQPEQKESGTDTSAETLTNAPEADDADINNIIKQLLATAKEQIPEANFYTTDSTEYAKIMLRDENILTGPDKAYGIVSNATRDEAIQKKFSEAHDYLRPVLTNNGFSEVNEFSDIPFVRFIFHNQQNDIYCRITTNPSSFVACAKGDWIEEEHRKLIVELAQASGQSIISARLLDIEDSPVSPYQRLEASLINSVGLFYRQSPNSSWTFFKAVQMILDCDSFDEEAAKAFAGTKCLDGGTKRTL